jgi:hypothetical protein
MFVKAIRRHRDRFLRMFEKRKKRAEKDIAKYQAMIKKGDALLRQHQNTPGSMHVKQEMRNYIKECSEHDEALRTQLEEIKIQGLAKSVICVMEHLRVLVNKKVMEIQFLGD